jgi:hypothetical protein
MPHLKINKKVFGPAAEKETDAIRQVYMDT